MRRIDAHQHFWTLARGDYGWLTPELGALYRDYGPEDLAPRLKEHAIEKTILVQAAPTLAETLYLLQVARSTRFVAGVVGWTNFDAPDAATVIDKLACDPLLVGLRPMVQDIPNDDWLLAAHLRDAFAALARNRLAFDALVVPRHLPRLLTVVQRNPELTFVVDHGAKPHIRARELDPWRDDVRTLAAHPNVVCKLSGLVTEAAAQWSVNDLRPYVDHLLAVFGPARLVWGSDWPVVNAAGGYERWFEATLTLLEPLSPNETEGILGGNAVRVYLSRHVRGTPATHP